MYQQHVTDLRNGTPCLREYILQDVGPVDGKSLVHLQCHMGMETLSWSMLGATSVGLDFSQPAIDKANQLRDELKLDTRFVCANVYDAPNAIGAANGGAFDIAFVSVGALCWLPDVPRWADVVRQLLKPAGRLYVNEVHPFLDVFDDADNGQQIEVKYAYLDAQPIVFENDGTYASPDAVFEHNQHVYYIHSIGTVINALIDAGFVIDRFTESSECGWPRFKMMEQVGPDDWAFEDKAMCSLPHKYTLMAHVG